MRRGGFGSRHAPSSYAPNLLSRNNSTDISNNLPILGITFKEIFDEVNKNLQIFVDDSSNKVGTYEQNFTKLIKYSNNSEFSYLTNIFLSDKGNELYKRMKEKITESPNLQVLNQQTKIISRTIIFLSQVFVNWKCHDKRIRTVQDKIYSQLKPLFNKDNEFLDLILSILFKQIDKERVNKEEEDKTVRWVLDLLIGIGLEDKLVLAFQKNSKEYLEVNPITEYNPSTIIQIVEQVIESNNKIFENMPEQFFQRVTMDFRNAAYSLFIIDSLADIFHSLFDDRNLTILNNLTIFINNSSNKSMQEKYYNLWYENVNKYIETLLLHNDYTMVSNIIKLIQFLNQIKLVLPAFVYEKLILVIKRAFNDSYKQGLYLIARYCHSFITQGDFKTLQTEIPMIIYLLKLFEDPRPFLDIYHNFYALRMIKYFSKPPPIEESFLSSLQSVFTDNTFENFHQITNDLQSYLQKDSQFDAKQSYPIKFLVISPKGWPTVPIIDNIPVPNEIMQARTLFEEYYLQNNKSIKLKWLPIIDEVTFVYKKVTFIGNYPYFLVFSTILENKPLEEITIPKHYLHEAIAGLQKMGLIARMAGKYVVASFKPHRKVNKFPALSFFNTRYPPKIITEDMIAAKKRKLETLIVRILKGMPPSNSDDLFITVSEQSVFNIKRKEFDMCISSLLASDTIAMSDNKLLRYVM